MLAERPWEALPPEIAPALRPGVGELAEEMIEAIRATVPAYARPLEGAFAEGVRSGVEGALSQFLDVVEDGHAGPLPGRALYADLGRGEAREGRSLEALLAAYRIGARVAWRRAAVRARELGMDDEVLALLAESIFAYIDELSAASAEGFAREQSAQAGGGRPPPAAAPPPPVPRPPPPPRAGGGARPSPCRARAPAGPEPAGRSSGGRGRRARGARRAAGHARRRGLDRERRRPPGVPAAARHADRRRARPHPRS